MLRRPLLLAICCAAAANTAHAAALRARTAPGAGGFPNALAPVEGGSTLSVFPQSLDLGASLEPAALSLADPGLSDTALSAPSAAALPSLEAPILPDHASPARAAAASFPREKPSRGSAASAERSPEGEAPSAPTVRALTRLSRQVGAARAALPAAGMAESYGLGRELEARLTGEHLAAVSGEAAAPEPGSMGDAPSAPVLSNTPDASSALRAEGPAIPAPPAARRTAFDAGRWGRLALRLLAAALVFLDIHYLGVPLAIAGQVLAHGIYMHAAGTLFLLPFAGDSAAPLSRWRALRWVQAMFRSRWVRYLPGAYLAATGLVTLAAGLAGGGLVPLTMGALVTLAGWGLYRFGWSRYAGFPGSLQTLAAYLGALGALTGAGLALLAPATPPAPAFLALSYVLAALLLAFLPWRGGPWVKRDWRLYFSAAWFAYPFAAYLLFMALFAGAQPPARPQPPPSAPAVQETRAAEGLPASLRAKAAAVRWTPAETERLVEKMPRFETHLHLDGSLSPETIQRLARRQNYAPLADKSVEQIAKLAVVGQSKDSLGEVLNAFNTFYPLLRSREAMREISYDLARSAARQNMRYMEVRFAPALQAAPGFSVDDAVDAVLEGLRRGEKDFGVRSGVIICLYRPLSLEQNEAMLESAIKHRGRGVVGIDLAGDEAKFPLSRFKELYRRAKEAGLFTTAHAGEVPGSADLETALELNVDRLDHATLLEQRPDLLRLVIQRRLPIGVNLTSNLRTSAIHSYKEHPIAAWYRAGIPVMISTDDPGVFGIDLAHEFRVLLELGFTPEDLIAIQWRTIDGLFLPPAEKQALRARFETEMGRLLSELAASHS